MLAPLGVKLRGSADEIAGFLEPTLGAGPAAEASPERRRRAVAEAAKVSRFERTWVTSVFRFESDRGASDSSYILWNEGNPAMGAPWFPLAAEAN
jgi:hypothetical protein